MKSLILLLVLPLLSASSQAASRLWQPGPGRYTISGPCNKLSQELNLLAQNKTRLDGGSARAPQLLPDAQQNCEAEFTKLLPNVVKRLDNKNWVDGLGGFGNCHGQAAYFAGLSPNLLHDEVAAVTQTAIRAQERFPGAPQVCQEVILFSDLRGGDLGVIYANRNNPLHSFTFLSQELTFSKNGHNGTKAPYKVHSLTSVADEYFTIKKVNHYRQGLKHDLDCLRDGSHKVRCESAGLPFARFYRCKTLAQLESLYRNRLPTEYFEIKEQAWQESQYYSTNRQRVLSATPVTAPSRGFWQNYNLVTKINNDLARQNRPDPVLRYFWAQLAANMRAINYYLDPQIRKIIFKP